MKKLKVDLDILFESFNFDQEELGQEFLDTITGDIINIPLEVMKVAEGDKDESTLADWQKGLLEDAKAVVMDEEDRYLLIPTIEDNFFYDTMLEFTNIKVKDEGIRAKLQEALVDTHPMRSFKDQLHNFSKELEQWYAFEDYKGKEYVTKWLSKYGIEIEYKM